MPLLHPSTLIFANSASQKFKISLCWIIFNNYRLAHSGYDEEILLEIT